VIAALLAVAFLQPGDEAPRFSGALYNAKAAGARSFDLAALVGDDAEAPGAKAVLVSFFASWCAPCRKELPLLQTLSKTYAARGLRVVSVAIDRDAEGMKQAEALVEENGVTYPVVKDRFNLIARRWLGANTMLPSLFIVGRDGLIKLVKQGYESDAAVFLRAEVERLLQ
jgi:thiol-disulfide isomerase/thioredoxin